MALSGQKYNAILLANKQEMGWQCGNAFFAPCQETLLVPFRVTVTLNVALLTGIIWGIWYPLEWTAWRHTNLGLRQPLTIDPQTDDPNIGFLGPKPDFPAVRG